MKRAWCCAAVFGIAAMLPVSGAERAAAQATPLGKLQQRVDELAKEAVDLHKKGQLLDARARMQYLFLLCQCPVGARLRCAASPGQTLQAVDNLNVALQERWTKELPGLEKKLNLVLRNRLLDEAVSDIAKASGVNTRLLPGSAEDACQLGETTECRIVWLDLRNATTAQALEWLTNTTRLDWRVAEGAVTVGSQRLLPGESAWVYEVSRLAHPCEKTEKTEDVAARNDVIRAAASAFRDAVKKALSLKDEEIHWRAPGQLLIWGTKATHGAAGELFAALAVPNARVADDLAALHELTRKRFVANEEGATKFIEACTQRRIMEAWQGFSWRLLAGATAKEVDLEALTELQAAWRAPQIAAVAKGTGALPAARSAFAITQAAKMLPQNDELAALAKQIVPLLRVRAPELVRAAEERPAAAPAALHAALALGDAELAKRTQAAYASSPVAAIADGLLGQTARPDALTELLKQPDALASDDWVLLAALACRRAGGETWLAWRAQASSIMGSRPLSGGVVVVVNRIGANPLPIAR